MQAAHLHAATTAINDSGRRILVGRVLGAFGIRGELKIESFTQPRAAIFGYQPWTLRDPQGRERQLHDVRGRQSGKFLMGQFPEVTDRDAAEAMRGTEIYIDRSAMPPPSPGEYYWVDLEGLRVVTVKGASLGVVSHLFSTGANDVLVARDDERERMIPFIQPQFITSVDFDAGVVTVDWDPDF